MMKRILTVLLVLVGSLTLSGSVWADSLWGTQSSSLCAATPHQFKVGDLVTIVIVEQAQATQSAESSNDKSGSVSAGQNTGVLSKIFPSMGASWDSKYEGTGSTTHSGTLKARITVNVTEVRPNGTIVFEGNQVIKINKENQVLKISGVARVEDVSADNVLYSTAVSDAVIAYEGKGTVSETQNTGLLTKFFNWLF